MVKVCTGAFVGVLLLCIVLFSVPQKAAGVSIFECDRYDGDPTTGCWLNDKGHAERRCAGDCPNRRDRWTLGHLFGKCHCCRCY